MSKTKRRLVVLESPYAGEVDANVEYARRAIRDSLERGEAPIASHLLYTQPGVLRDDVPEEREWGIGAGHEWLRACDAVVFYCDRGVSRGMSEAILRATELGVPMERRFLDGAPPRREIAE